MKHATDIICVVFFLAALPEAQAQFTYTTNADNTVAITGYTGPGGAVTLPASINGLPVTTIWPWVFSFSGTVTSVTIPDGVTTIGGAAFYNCTNLTSVTIPASVTNIGDQLCCYSSNLTAITVDPQNPLYSSQDGVLFDKSQTTLFVYPGGLVGSYAIPGSVSTILAAFCGCLGLTSLSIPGSVNSIEDEAIRHCPNLGSVTIAGTIASLQNDLFVGCGSLTNVYFHGNAPTIAPAVDDFLGAIFYGDPNATAFYLPGTTGWSTTLADIPAVVLAEKASSEFSYATNDSAITITGYTCSGGLVVIPEFINGLPVTAIGENAFEFCTNLTGIAVPGSVTNIAGGAFEFCTGLSDVVILPGVASIGDDAFEGCFNLSSVVIPGSVNNIGSEAFEGCVNLTGVVLQPGVTNIGDGAFEGCVSLRRLTIPGSVTTIGNNAFESCFSLDYAYFYCNAPTVGPGLFNNDMVSTIYYSPCATGWGATFAGIPAVAVTASDQFAYVSFDGITIPTGYAGSCGVLVFPTNIAGFPISDVGDPGYGDNFAEGNSILTSVTIPGCVTSIVDNAFSFCPNLGSVTIEEGVTTTGETVFANCGSLTNVSLPASLTNIGAGMFNGCTGMTTLPSNITTLGVEEFGYSGLTDITIPDCITSIPPFAFMECNSLTNVKFHDGLTSIGIYSFYGTALRSVTIPASVTLIGGDAFKFCSVLTNVYFLGNAPSVSGGAEAVFYYDLNATAYYLPGATGWSSPYQEIPAVLWNPLIQTGNGNFGVQNNQFRFDITGTPAIPIVVEASTNLANPVWTRLTNVTLTNGLFHFSEPAQPNTPNRYYRITSP